MPYELEIPDAHRRQGWRVKIRDNERVEAPHASIVRRTRTWRVGLRDLRFLDRRPAPREVPREILELVRRDLDLLRAQWDGMYPDNPTGGNDAP